MSAANQVLPFNLAERVLKSGHKERHHALFMISLQLLVVWKVVVVCCPLPNSEIFHLRKLKLQSKVPAQDVSYQYKPLPSHQSKLWIMTLIAPLLTSAAVLNASFASSSLNLCVTSFRRSTTPP